MNLKVHANPRGQAPSESEVKSALPKDMPGLTVEDNQGGYVWVGFSKGASDADWKRVQQALRNAGFGTE